MGRSGYAWWVAWVLWSAPVGALACIGLIEFNWGGPPYDGGFAGDLMLFGGFLALGQAPFVMFFVSSLSGSAVDTAWTGLVSAVSSAVSWMIAGFVGWTMGSFLEVGLATPLYSGAGVLAGVLPWILVGAIEAVVLAAALASVLSLRASDRPAPSGRAGRSVTLVVSGLVWIVSSVIGGLLYEYWVSLDVAARQNPIKDAIGTYLEGVGIAENLAFEVVPGALAFAILYGIVTGLVLVAIHRLVNQPASRAERPLA